MTVFFFHSGNLLCFKGGSPQQPQRPCSVNRYSSHSQSATLHAPKSLPRKMLVASLSFAESDCAARGDSIGGGKFCGCEAAAVDVDCCCDVGGGGNAPKPLVGGGPKLLFATGTLPLSPPLPASANLLETQPGGGGCRNRPPPLTDPIAGCVATNGGGCALRSNRKYGCSDSSSSNTVGKMAEFLPSMKASQPPDGCLRST